MKEGRTNSDVRLLDQVDLAIIRQLGKGARQSAQDLSGALGVSRPTVMRRIQKLIASGVLRFAVITDPRTLGFEAWSLLGLTTNPGKSESVAHHLKPIRSVKGIMLTTGRYGMWLYVVTSDQEELMRLVDEQLGSVPDIVATEVINLVSTRKYSWEYLGDSTHPLGKTVPRVLEDSELKLIRELELNPRESIVNLAKRIGLSSISTSRKLQSLITDNITRIVAICDPSVLGYNTQTVTFMRVKPGHIFSVADSLVKDRRVPFVGITTGRFNICLWAIFQDSSEMSHFVRHELAAMPSVIGYEMMVLGNTPKLSYSFLSDVDSI